MSRRRTSRTSIGVMFSLSLFLRIVRGPRAWGPRVGEGGRKTTRLFFTPRHAVAAVAAKAARIAYATAGAALTCFWRCASPHPWCPALAGSRDLGSIDFPTSIAGGTAAFHQGRAVDAFFEHDDAREAFVEAQKADPNFAMAYWGEAMTFNHAVWQRTSPDLAKAALNKLAPTAGGAPRQGDDREGEGLAWRRRAALRRRRRFDFAQRRQARARSRVCRRDEADARQYPADDEVRSFYALALLGTSHGGRDFSIYMRAAALVEQVYAKNPQHPGAAHYLIHAYDDPIHAPLGLRYADAYSKTRRQRRMRCICRHTSMSRWGCGTNRRGSTSDPQGPPTPAARPSSSTSTRAASTPCCGWSTATAAGPLRRSAA